MNNKLSIIKSYSTIGHHWSSTTLFTFKPWIGGNFTKI
jgi:hypothetical protein